MTGSAFVLRGDGRTLAPGSPLLPAPGLAPGDASPVRAGSDVPVRTGSGTLPSSPVRTGLDALPALGEDDGETTTGPPRSSSSSAARTSSTDITPAAATNRPRRITVPRCFMRLTLTPFEETTLRPR